MAIMLLGQPLAKKIYKELAKAPGLERMKLAVVQVGNQLASTKYIEEKRKACQNLGIKFLLAQYPETISQNDLENAVGTLGQDSAVTAILVQLPLPSHIANQRVLDCIPFEKDVDVLSSARFGYFLLSSGPLLPPTVHAISLLLHETKMSVRGKEVAVVGAGRLVGLPVFAWLVQQGASVNLVRQSTKDKNALLKRADIVISGVGKKHVIQGKMIKKGAVVIDAGTSVESGKTAGDVDMASVSKKAKAISPVPGGVGPLTVACLLDNVVKVSKG